MCRASSNLFIRGVSTSGPGELGSQLLTATIHGNWVTSSRGLRTRKVNRRFCFCEAWNGGRVFLRRCPAHCLLLSRFTSCRWSCAQRESAPDSFRSRALSPSSSQELLAHRVDSRPRVVNGTGGLSPGPNGPEELEFRRRIAAPAIEIGNYSAAILEDENTRRNQQNCRSVMIRKPPKARTGPQNCTYHVP